MLQIVREMFEVLRESFQTYSGGNTIWILYVLALPVIFFLGKKEDRKLFIGSLLVECLTVFNPFFMKIAIDKLGLENRFARFFWMIVFYMTIAYAVVLLVFAMKKKWLRLLAGVLCVGTIVLVGTPVFSNEDGVSAYKMVENEYFNSNYILSIANILHSEGIENPKVLYGGDLIMNYRQFDPTVISAINRKTYDKTQSVTFKKLKKWKGCNDQIKRICKVYFYQDYSVDTEEFYENVKAERIHYVVSTSAELDVYLENTPATILADTGVSRIWKIVY